MTKIKCGKCMGKGITINDQMLKISCFRCGGVGTIETVIITPEQIKEQIKVMRSNGMSYLECADKLFISYSTVRRICLQNSIPFLRRRKKSSKYDLEIVKKVILMRNSGMKFREISEKTKLSISTISVIFHESKNEF